jgi:hypothetical protein
MSKTFTRLCRVNVFRRLQGLLASTRRHEYCFLTRFRPNWYGIQSEITTQGLLEFLHINDAFTSHIGEKGRLKKDPWHGQCKDVYDELAKSRNPEKNPTETERYE